MSNEIRKPLFRQIVERQVWREDIQMIPQGDVFFIRAVRPPVYISYLLNELVEDIEQRFFTYLPHLIQFVFVGADILLNQLLGNLQFFSQAFILEINTLLNDIIEVGIDDVVRYSLRIGRPLPDLLLGTVPFRRVDTVPHGRKKPYSADGYGNTYREIPVFIAPAVQIKVYRHILHEIVTHKYKHTFP